MGDALEPVDREEVWDQVLNEPVHHARCCYTRYFYSRFLNLQARMANPSFVLERGSFPRSCEEHAKAPSRLIVLPQGTQRCRNCRPCITVPVDAGKGTRRRRGSQSIRVLARGARLRCPRVRHCSFASRSTVLARSICQSSSSPQVLPAACEALGSRRVTPAVRQGHGRSGRTRWAKAKPPPALAWSFSWARQLPLACLVLPW